MDEKTVSSEDEDSLTMAYESAHEAIASGKINTKHIDAVFFGSESPSYAVNPSSTILAEFLGIEGAYLASDLQFACKAATGSLISAASLVDSGKMRQVLVAASDKATGRPHDALEYTAASGSVCLIVGKQEGVAKIIDSTSYSSDTPDFWRREGMRYPSHGGRFTGKPSYFHHITRSVEQLMQKNRLKPTDIDHAVFHMPNGKFPRQIAAQLGFSEKQIKHSLVVGELGNSYTASSLMGLVAVFEYARPDERILLASYGSGAGSDAFILQMGRAILNNRKSLKKAMKIKEYVDYQTYLKFMNII